MMPLQVFFHLQTNQSLYHYFFSSYKNTFFSAPVGLPLKLQKRCLCRCFFTCKRINLYITIFFHPTKIHLFHFPKKKYPIQSEQGIFLNHHKFNLRNRNFMNCTKYTAFMAGAFVTYVEISSQTHLSICIMFGI